jgi:hypothetical protein
MRKVTRVLFLVFSSVFAISPSYSSAQEKGRGQVQRKWENSPALRLPDTLSAQVDALGERTKKRDKDRTVLKGQFDDGQNKSRSAQVTIQLPQGFARLEGFLPGETAVVFDGDTYARRPRIDASMLETFAVDTVEGMLAAIQGGAAFQLLALDSRPDQRSNDKDPRHYVIYEVTDLVRMDGSESYRQKFYYFDRDTGLLAKTKYMDGPRNVEVRFSEWKATEGSAYAGQIERFEDNRFQFSFKVLEILAGEQKEAASFHQK